MHAPWYNLNVFCLPVHFIDLFLYPYISLLICSPIISEYVDDNIEKLMNDLKQLIILSSEKKRSKHIKRC